MSTDLFKAAHDNDLEAINLAIGVEQQDVNAQHPRAGTIPLQLACQADAIDAVRLLLALGADASRVYTHVSRVDGRVFRDRFPLLYVQSAAVARVLLDAGADINAADGNGETVLASAVLRGNIDLCRFLLEQGARSTVKVRWRGDEVSLREMVVRYREHFREIIQMNPVDAHKANDAGREMIRRLDQIETLLDPSPSIS